MILLWIFLIIFGVLLWPVLLWLDHRHNFEQRFAHWLRNLFFFAALLSLGSNQAEAKSLSSVEFALICKNLILEARKQNYKLRQPFCVWQHGYVVLVHKPLVGKRVLERGVLMKWVGGKQ